MSSDAEVQRELVGEALALLGKERLVLVAHDASFPGLPEEDVGRGSPYSEGARRFLAFAHGLGFTAVQLGPQGRTTLHNPSPYDATLFTKSELSVALGALAAGGELPPLLEPRELHAHLQASPSGARTDLPRAHAAVAALLDRAYQRFAAGREGRFGALAAALADFREANASWLVRDGLFEALAARQGTEDWRRWPEADQRLFVPGPGEEGPAAARRASLARELGPALERHAFGQWLLQRQHAALRAWLGGHQLKLLGDLQVGISHADSWSLRGAFLPGYVMGAPPSRTNPAGQPWSYPVLDPRQYRGEDGGDGPALSLLRTRMDRLLGEFDGVRIDHPHGLVCPWVYRADVQDPFAAVQGGARLFSSPDLADHPALAAFRIVRPEQLDRSQPRHADGWVRALDEAQVDRYATGLEVVMERVRHHGRHTHDVLCEVLSTWPFPLERVMARYGLGRFFVTQKADPDDPRDVYRSEHARRQDWVMPGTHDTESLWELSRRWQGTEAGRRRAAYLAWRLQPRADARTREALAQRLAGDAHALAQAVLADLFVSPAGSVSLFFPDLLGMTERYNVPGTVGPENWSLRVPADFARLHRERCAQGAALHLPSALATAMRARGLGAHPLCVRLEQQAGAWAPSSGDGGR